MKKIKVAELFAGVGGFRLGLDSASSKDVKYEVVWSNQWEPGAKIQYASEIYVNRFGEKGHCCRDIQDVVKNDFNEIKDHDLLVGGFPCQDYSVARTLNQAAGIEGKKGVLWWSIYNILKKRGKKAPKFLMLENVDRLLKSPASQRGRDFAIMLASLADLNYAVEWRVVNAADYGFPQRRRRIFILGYRKGTKMFDYIKKEKNKYDFLCKNSVIAKAFPVKEQNGEVYEEEINGVLSQVSENFSANRPSKSPFENAGVMINRKFYTAKVVSNYSGKAQLLKHVVLKDKDVSEDFFVKDDDVKRWEYLKGAKKEERKTKTGHVYYYAEGPMVFPDSLDRPSRTIVTGEGGSSPSRFKHVIKTQSGKFRRLHPRELERLNMFPDDHTRYMLNNKETPNVRRAFIMGNALVVGVIRELGKSLCAIAKDEK